MPEAKAKVAIVSYAPFDKHGRLQRFVASLANAGFNVVVVCWRPWHSVRSQGSGSSSNVEMIELPYPSQGLRGRFERVYRNTRGLLGASGDLQTLSRLLPWLPEEQFHKLRHGNAVTTVIAMHALCLPLGVAIARACQARLVYDITEAATEQFDYSWRWRWLERPFIRRLEASLITSADKCISSSPGFAKLAVENSRKFGVKDPVDIEYIENYPDTDGRIREPDFTNGATSTILYQGLAGPDRFLEETIESVLLWPSHCSLILQLVGGEREKSQLKRLVSRNGLGERVRFIEPASANDLVSAAAATGAIGGLCLLSPVFMQSRLALTNKLFTYIQAGIVPISNADTFTGDFCERHDLGPVIKDCRSDSIAAAVRVLVEDGAAQRRFAVSISKHQPFWRWSSVEKRFLEIVG